MVDFSLPLPIASISDIIQIGGYNCMCIGENRYVYMYNLGTTYWGSAVSAAQNWTPPVGITSMYNVSNKSLPTYNECIALAQYRDSLLSLYNIGRIYAWVGSENQSVDSRAYFLYEIGVYTGEVDKVYQTCAVLPAFTISRKGGL